MIFSGPMVRALLDGRTFRTQDYKTYFRDDGTSEYECWKTLEPIIATFPTREEALAYATPLPVEVDWKARAEAAEVLVKVLTEAGWEAWNQACEIHDKPPPVKYMAPYGGLVKLHAALVAAAKEPRHE